MRLFLIVAILGACTQFPALDRVATPGIEDAPFPDLLPLDVLLEGPAPRAVPEVASGIAARVAGLRARAARLQAPVVPAAVKARMRAGVAPI